MLKTACINPDLIGLLAQCGHGDKVLIADGNYPLDSNTANTSAKIYLGLTHGIPLVTQVLDVLGKTVAIENAEVMVPETGDDPEIFSDFKNLLPDGMKLNKLGRYEFYDACKKDNVKIAISTGEQRIFANILITIGVV
jgi:L-fucose mutarotase